MDLHRLGETVKTLRKRKGMTQSQLAGAELTKGYISQIEHGRIAPSIRTLGLLSSRLGCSLSDLVGPGIATSVLDEAEAAFMEGDLTTAWARLEQVGGAKELVPRYLVLASEISAPLGKEQTLKFVAQALDEGTLSPTDRARVLASWGVYLASLGKMEEALDKFEQAHALLDGGTADVPLRLRVLSNCGNLSMRLGHYQRALECLHESLSLSRRSGVHLVDGKVYAVLGIAYRHLGEFAQAEDAHRRALLYYRADDDLFMIASSEHNLGLVYRDMGRLDEAETQLRKAKETLEAHFPGHPQTNNSRFELARVFVEQERPEEAHQALLQVDGNQLATIEDKAKYPVLLAQCQRRLGRSEEALKTLKTNTSVLEAASTELRIQSLKEQAFALMELGRVQEAQRAIDQSMELMGGSKAAGGIA